MNPLPRRDPKRERKMRREKGAAKGNEESAEANVRTSTWKVFRDSETFLSSISNLAALDLLWCENQQEGNVDQDVGDCDDGETQDDRPGRHTSAGES